MLFIIGLAGLPAHRRRPLSSNVRPHKTRPWRLKQMTRIVELRSARDGMTIVFSDFVPEDSSSLSESFLVTIKSHEIRAETRASSYRSVSLAEYFRDIAENWRGWNGRKHWATLEGELEFTATSDKTGHVRLGFSLRPPYTGFHWEVRGALELEAGQLDAIAEEVQQAWPTQSAA